MARAARALLAALLAVAAPACVTIESVRPAAGAPPRGVAEVYPYPFEVVFDLACETAIERSLVIRERRPDLRYFLADDAAEPVPYGRVVAVSFEPVDAGSTRVFVVARTPIVPLFKVNVRNYAALLHGRLREKLELR